MSPPQLCSCFDAIVCKMWFKIKIEWFQTFPSFFRVNWYFTISRKCPLPNPQKMSWNSWGCFSWLQILHQGIFIYLRSFWTKNRLNCLHCGWIFHSCKKGKNPTLCFAKFVTLLSEIYPSFTRIDNENGPIATYVTKILCWN